MAHAIRRVEELQRNGDHPLRARESEDRWQHVLRAPRTVFAGHIPPDLFPYNMPDHQARDRALREMRETLSKASMAMKHERIAKWKN